MKQPSNAPSQAVLLALLMVFLPARGRDRPVMAEPSGGEKRAGLRHCGRVHQHLHVGNR